MPNADGSVDALVFWVFAVAWVVLLGLILFGALPRAAREGLRVAKRVSALVNESPLPKQIATAQADLGRIESALDALPGLGRRARAAAHCIRSTPLVPPAVLAVAERVRRELRAFRTSRG